MASVPTGRPAGRAWRIVAAAVAGALLTAAPARTQIVDPFSSLPDAGEGTAAELEGRLGLETGNTELLSAGAGATLRRAGAVHQWKLLLDYSRTEWDGEKLSESGYGHVRHNRAITAAWSTLAFVQVQHEPFQRLTSRVLLGAGARLDFLRLEKSAASFGVSPMLEIEDVQDEDPLVRGRMSTFLRVVRKAPGNPRIEATVFAQPGMEDPGDLRVLVRSSARVDLARRFALVLRFGLTHDSEPPAGVERTDTQTRVGVVWSLG